jgi:hypothetical protein
MSVNFCTLFNSAYLSRGLAMYHSLLKQNSNVHLYVLAFDEDCAAYLERMGESTLTVIRLKDFETPELKTAKQNRSATEYMWTCSASIIYHCITRFELKECTYLDADMLFYADPSILISEMGDNDVLITSHRYSAEYNQSNDSGKYCVQFVTFKATERGMKILRWWKDSCIEWCYNRLEDGKFGDQKYLESFQPLFGGTHELMHHGGGLAPWNVQQYSFRSIAGKIMGKVLATNEEFEPVFFHFHGLRFYDNEMVELAGARYELSIEVKELFYFPYVRILNAEFKSVVGKNSAINPQGTAGKVKLPPRGWYTWTYFFLSGVKQSLRNLGFSYAKRRMARHHVYDNKQFNA